VEFAAGISKRHHPDLRRDGSPGHRQLIQFLLVRDLAT
jgi:hypothetical protein